METIDTMQNGDIKQLRSPIAPISLSDSRGLVGGRGRLALDMDESQLYTNERGQLCLMTPVEVITQEMSASGTPLTFNFQSGEISRGDVTFPLSNSNVTPDLIAKSITTNDVNIQSQNVTLYKISNMLYLVGFVTLTSTIQIPPETRIYNISFPSITVTKPLHGAISPHAYSTTIPYVRFNTSNSSFIVMNMTQIQKAFTFTINFSHIIGYI